MKYRPAVRDNNFKDQELVESGVSREIKNKNLNHLKTNAAPLFTLSRL